VTESDLHEPLQARTIPNQSGTLRALIATALSKVGITKDAAQAYKNLKAHYKGKTVTDLGVLLASVGKTGRKVLYKID